MTHQEFKKKHIDRLVGVRKVAYYLGLIKFKSYSDETNFKLTIEERLVLINPLAWLSIILTWVYHILKHAVVVAVEIFGECTNVTTTTQINWDEKDRI